jgi:hypothetical protein
VVAEAIPVQIAKAANARDAIVAKPNKCFMLTSLSRSRTAS